MSNTITEVIRSRRTVKPGLMSDREIDRVVLDEILENAIWAPTHGMTQPWRFKVFTGASRKQLADFLAATYKSITTPETFKQKKYDSFSVNPTKAGAVLAVGMKRQENGKITELDELLAVACAVQNMHLTATHHGVGGFWSTNIAAVSDEMRDFMGLSGDDRALGLFYLGYPNSDLSNGDLPTSNREPVESRVSWA